MRFLECAMPYATKVLDFGGKNLTEYLQILMERHGHKFESLTEKRSVREMKKLCRVESKSADSPSGDLPYSEIVFKSYSGRVYKLLADAYFCGEISFNPKPIGHKYGKMPF